MVVQQAEAFLDQIVGRTKAKKQFKELLRRDYRSCECALPHLVRKWNGGLGVFVEIRLCCMAKALERLTGERFFIEDEFEPLWTWDCDEIRVNDDGVEAKVGPPPQWMLKKMRERGREVKNLPKGL